VTLRYGISLPLTGELADPRTLAALAAEAEMAGWAGIFARAPAAFPDPYIVLAAVACATSAVTLGLLDPADGPAETLALLAAGRLVLSAAVGEIPWWTGVSWPTAAVDRAASGVVASGVRSSSDVALLVDMAPGVDVVLLGGEARHEDGTAADFEALAAAGATWWLETVGDSLAGAYATITAGPPGP
jgi:hypothetical protein